MKRLTTDEAARRLGVKRETLYAYVSRGMLTRERSPEGRASTYSAEEVEALAARVRRGGRAGGLEVVVASELTLIEGDRLYYRGHDATALARTVPFEAVAELLWTGPPDVLERPPAWPPVRAAATGPRTDPVNRLRRIVADAASADDLRYDLEPASVAAAGRRLLGTMVAALPLLGEEPHRPGPFPLAARLWPRLGPTRPTAGLVAALNAVLVLLADHELAASTLAARIAASVRADPYSVVSTGLGVIAGGLHGAASEPVVALLAEVGEPDRAGRVVGERLRRAERIPGLGHKVYRRSDPRAELLLELLRALPLPRARWSVVEAVHALVTSRLEVPVNVDFALGSMVFATGMELPAAEVVFSIARSAGWLAHALEEYAEDPVRFRTRAVYTGVRPSSGARPGGTARRR